MKRSLKYSLLVALGIIVLTLIILFLAKQTNQNQDYLNMSCVSDSDCVPAQCCHADSCINKNFKGVCNLLCTNVCSGPLDCNIGYCGCVKGKCSVVSSLG
jgi:hypothetical protein